MERKIFKFWKLGQFTTIFKVLREATKCERSPRYLVVYSFIHTFCYGTMLLSGRMSVFEEETMLQISLITFYCNTYLYNTNLFYIHSTIKNLVFNRPNVAGAVLHTPLSLINSLTDSSFSSKSSRHLHLLTVWARDLKLWDNIYLPTCVTCPCHVSLVTCYV